MEQPLTAFIFGLGAALGLVPICRLAAFRLNVVARPSADRWHKQPTPLMGGLAIFGSVLFGSFLFNITEPLWLFLLTGGLISAIGLSDDAVPIKPSTKLIAEIVIASILLFFGYRLEWSSSLVLDAMLTMVWIVGVTNAFNLLDNMDGLCAGIAAVAAGALLAGIYPIAGITPTTLFLAMLLGSTLGFLVYNFNPASIFMGDSGSLFLGLSLAAIALQLPRESAARSNMLSVMAAPLLVLLIPIFDTTLVTLSRLFSGRRPSQGGRDHSSHRLVAIGLPERTAVLVLWTLAALGGTIGLTLHDPYADSTVVPAALFVLAMIIFAAYLARVRVYDNQDSALQAGRITPFVVDLMYKRRVLEVMLDVCLVVLAYYSAYGLRFEGAEYSEFFPSFIQSLPLVLGVQIVVFFVVGVYRGVWRYFGLMDGVVLAKGVVAGTVVQVLLILYVYRFEHYSRGVFIIYAGTLMLFLAGSRASFRLISEFARRRRAGHRLIVYGAGDGGSLVVRELLNDNRVTYRMLGFIDDDPNKRRARVQGYPVLGGYDSLLSLVTGGAVDAVVISTRLLAVDRLRELEHVCAAHNVRLSRLHFRLEEMVAVS